MKFSVKSCTALISLVIIFSCKKDIDFREPVNKEKGASTAAKTLAISNTYFVSTSGNDANDGLSASSPWKTITKVNSALLAAGDMVLFEGGKTFNGSLYITANGSSGASIRLASYGTGRATINGGNSHGIFMYNASYIIVDSLIVKGAWDSTAQSGNNAYGVFFYNDLPLGVKLGDITVSHCEVKGFYNPGIGILAWPADKSQSGYSKITITDNSVHDNGAAGISILGPSASAGNTVYAFPDIYVARNKVYNNMGIKANTTNHTGNGIIISDASGGKIESNVAYNNGWYSNASSGGPAAIWCYDSKNIIFQFNEAHHNGTGKGKPDGDGFDLDGGAVNCTMQYNYSHDNYAAGFLVWEFGNSRIKNGNNTIRYNISQNDNTNNNNSIYGGITIGPGCNNNLVYNNTIWSIKGSAVFVTGGTGNKFYNNIFESKGSASSIVSTSGSFFMNNNYYNSSGFRVKYSGTTYTSLTSYRNTGNEKYNNVAVGYGMNPKLSNPGNAASFNNGNPSAMTNYLPLSGSPMINTAFDLTTLGINVGSKDFKKASIPYNGAYDIGACEWH